MVDNRFLDHQQFGSMICVIFAPRDESLSPMEQGDHGTEETLKMLGLAGSG